MISLGPWCTFGYDLVYFWVCFMVFWCTFGEFGVLLGILVYFWEDFGVLLGMLLTLPK